MKRLRGVLDAELEKYRPGEAINRDELLAARRTAHDNSHLRAHCRYCQQEFSGTRAELHLLMGEHMRGEHGSE